MPYRVQPAEAIKRLTQEVQAKQEVVAQLQQEKEELIYRQLLLNAVLDAFQLVLGSESTAEEQKLLLQLDGLHLQQSSSNSSSSISSSATYPTELHAGSSTGNLQQLNSSNVAQQEQYSAHSTIAPEDDPIRPVMALLPPTPLDAASITLQQLQKGYQHTISTLAVNIGLLEEQQHQQQQDASIPTSSSTPSCSNGSDDAAAAALSAIQCALQCYWAQLNVLLRGGRGELTHAYILSNVLTGESVHWQLV
jgi:hypothetical protein